MLDPQDQTNQPFRDASKLLRAAVYVYAAGSIAAGVMDLIWRDFEAGHQPIQALGDHVSGVTILACVAGIWLIAGGAAIAWPRTARAGAVALAAIYSIFGMFWFPRFYTAPRLLGLSPRIVIGLFVGVGQQLVLVAAAGIIYALFTVGAFSLPPALRLVLRAAFGLSSVCFGLAHFTSLQVVTRMVPSWLPFGGDFWSMLTGSAFIAAGIAILLGLRDVLAARMLALMLFLFNVLVLAPGAATHLHNHVAWGSNAYNLAAAGAAWIFAESSARTRRSVPSAAMVPEPS